MSVRRAKDLADHILGNYADYATRHNMQASDLTPEVPTRLPRVVEVQDDLPVAHIEAYVEHSEHDLKAVQEFVDRCRAQIEKETSTERIGQVAKEVSEYASYMNTMLGAIREHFDNALEEMRAPESLEKRIVDERPHVSSMKHRLFDFGNLLLNPFGAPYSLGAPFRDFHPQWYVGTRGLQSPLQAAYNEFDRLYVTAGYLYDESLDAKSVVKAWLSHRVNVLQQMGLAYKLLKEDAERKLRELKAKRE